MRTVPGAHLLAAITAEAARVHAADPGQNCTAEERDDHGLRLRYLASFVLGLLNADGRL